MKKRKQDSKFGRKRASWKKKKKTEENIEDIFEFPENENLKSDHFAISEQVERPKEEETMVK